ncbi:MAG: hypothetical protein ABIC04_08020 [Nanoarchaeota archaeon]
MKKYFLAKLKVVGFVFALAGWLLLTIFLFGKFFVEELIQLEIILKSKTFIWGLRIFVIALVIALIKGQKLVTRVLKNKKIRTIIYIIYIMGSVGWIRWIISLI